MDNGCAFPDCSCQETTPTLHTIKPLEWKKFTDEYLQEGWEVDTPLGKYEVWLNHIGSFAWEAQRSITQCTSIEDGKAQAEKHYMEQIGKCLEVYNA